MKQGSTGGSLLSVRNDVGELGAVQTATEDDFMFFRDSFHLALEAIVAVGELGSEWNSFDFRSQIVL
jgi:hypothetical protein